MQNTNTIMFKVELFSSSKGFSSLLCPDPDSGLKSPMKVTFYRVLLTYCMYCRIILIKWFTDRTTRLTNDSRAKNKRVRRQKKGRAKRRNSCTVHMLRLFLHHRVLCLSVWWLAVRWHLFDKAMEMTKIHASIYYTYDLCFLLFFLLWNMSMYLISSHPSLFWQIIY